MPDFFPLCKGLIHRLPPEIAHNAGLLSLRLGLWSAPPPVHHASLAVKALGLEFPNPIGLAAGFDKNAVALRALARQGFGFMEAGTVTPRAQPGNPAPRIFRLREDEAVINRLGFNNEGLTPFVKRLRRKPRKNMVGANIGKNKDTANAVLDYVAGIERVYPYADYITINISSPNTPGLRDLQQREALASLLAILRQADKLCRERHGREVPLLLKVAPDLTMPEKEAIAQTALDYGMAGLIVSNTTLARRDLKGPHRQETGGLSGKPLFALSTEALSDFYRLTGGKMTLIGAGGIASAEDAYIKIRAGATLLQLYTALVYQGFGLVREIIEGLAERLDRDGFSHIQEAVGADVK